ncbi:hypothetical protein [Fodinicola acaciae]|uniref:hypothetical protein n=1 Tax=Fodinicola acaciae TaxID=2681555 RepID=UPI0013D7D6E3|nr:hypothetical protein [Fodinicola acaciae]
MADVVPKTELSDLETVAAEIGRLRAMLNAIAPAPNDSPRRFWPPGSHSGSRID